MLRSTLHTNIPLQLLKSVLLLFLCIIVTWAVLRQSGINMLSFILLNIMSRESFKLLPMTPSLNSSLLLPLFRLFSTVFSSIMLNGGLFLCFDSSILIRKVSSCTVAISSVSSRFGFS